MSVWSTVNLRKRWSARSMILKRWISEGGAIYNGTPICELETDGAVETIVGTGLHEPYCAWRHFVQEGGEVNPTLGRLLTMSSAISPKSANWERNWHPEALRPLVRRPKYPSVFLSYRRLDAEAYAGRLHEQLSKEFGSDEVFMDIFSLRAGERFGWTIQQAIVHAKVVVVLIGSSWATAKDGHGNRRLDSPSDTVRLEIGSAFDTGKAIVPVLLPGARIPGLSQPEPTALPEPLDELENLQMAELSARHWSSDVRTVVDIIGENLTAMKG